MQPERGNHKVPVVIHYLGLFYWADELLTVSEIVAVAQALTTNPAPPLSTLHPGWFDLPRKPGRVVVHLPGGAPPVTVAFQCDACVTHSRLVATIRLDLTRQDVESALFVRELRRELNDWINQLLSPLLQQVLSTNEMLAKFPKDTPDPFLLFYPIIVIPGYGTEVCVASRRSEGYLPIDDLSSCFCVQLRDHASEPRYPSRSRFIWLRVSGASIIMDQPSPAFARRLVNLIYYAGLYEISRPNHKLVGRTPRPAPPAPLAPRIRFDLEPLLERQGDAIVNSFTQRGLEDESLRISNRIVILTVVLIVATVVSVLVEKFIV